MGKPCFVKRISLSVLGFRRDNNDEDRAPWAANGAEAAERGMSPFWTPLETQALNVNHEEF